MTYLMPYRQLKQPFNMVQKGKYQFKNKWHYCWHMLGFI